MDKENYINNEKTEKISIEKEDKCFFKPNRNSQIDEIYFNLNSYKDKFKSIVIQNEQKDEELGAIGGVGTEPSNFNFEMYSTKNVLKYVRNINQIEKLEIIDETDNECDDFKEEYDFKEDYDFEDYFKEDCYFENDFKKSIDINCEYLKDDFFEYKLLENKELFEDEELFFNRYKKSVEVESKDLIENNSKTLIKDVLKDKKENILEKLSENNLSENSLKDITKIKKVKLNKKHKKQKSKYCVNEENAEKLKTLQHASLQNDMLNIDLNIDELSSILPNIFQENSCDFGYNSLLDLKNRKFVYNNLFNINSLITIINSLQDNIYYSIFKTNYSDLVHECLDDANINSIENNYFSQIYRYKFGIDEDEEKRYIICSITNNKIIKEISLHGNENLKQSCLKFNDIMHFKELLIINKNKDLKKTFNENENKDYKNYYKNYATSNNELDKNNDDDDYIDIVECDNNFLNVSLNSYGSLNSLCSFLEIKNILLKKFTQNKEKKVVIKKDSFSIYDILKNCKSEYLKENNFKTSFIKRDFDDSKNFINNYMITYDELFLHEIESLFSKNTYLSKDNNLLNRFIFTKIYKNQHNEDVQVFYFENNSNINLSQYSYLINLYNILNINKNLEISFFKNMSLTILECMFNEKLLFKNMFNVSDIHKMHLKTLNYVKDIYLNIYKYIKEDDKLIVIDLFNYNIFVLIKYMRNLKNLIYLNIEHYISIILFNFISVEKLIFLTPKILLQHQDKDNTIITYYEEIYKLLSSLDYFFNFQEGFFEIFFKVHKKLKIEFKKFIVCILNAVVLSNNLLFNDFNYNKEKFLIKFLQSIIEDNFPKITKNIESEFLQIYGMVLLSKKYIEEVENDINNISKKLCLIDKDFEHIKENINLDLVNNFNIFTLEKKNLLSSEELNLIFSKSFFKESIIKITNQINAVFNIRNNK